MLIPLDAVRIEQLQAQAAAHRPGRDRRCTAHGCREPGRSCWYRLDAQRILAGAGYPVGDDL